MEELIKAVVKAKSEFKPLGKTATNTRFANTPGKGKYSSNSDVAEAIDKALLDNGLFFTHKTVVDDGKHYLQGTLYHSSGQFMDAGMYPLNSSGDPQKLLGEITYARRGQKCAFFDVNADIDDDGNSLTPASNGNGKTTFTKAATNGSFNPKALYAAGMKAFSSDGPALSAYLKSNGVPSGNTNNVKDKPTFDKLMASFKSMEKQEVDF